MHRGSTASISGLGPASQLCHDTAKVQLSPARERGQGSGRERDPPSLGRFGLSPQGLWSKIKTCRHNFYQCSLHRFSCDDQGRRRFPPHASMCISRRVLVSRSQSLSIEGLSAIFGPKCPGNRRQSGISSSKRKAARSFFKGQSRLSPITILPPPKYANTLSTSLTKYS